MGQDPLPDTGTTTARDFLAAVGTSGVLTAEQAGRLERLAARGELPGDPSELAARLVRDGVLTEFQASRLRVGRGDSLVVGNYALIQWIGSGAMGVVFKARHRLMDRVVALKAMSPRAPVKTNALARFLREMKLVGLLDHPNVVRAFDAGLHNGAPYFVMEFLSGENLEDVGRKRHCLSPEEVVGHMVQAARGLAHAHERGVIHRDIKPSNLFLDAKGHIKILDLGLGVLFEQAGADELAEWDGTAVTVGTADYMSPEQLTGGPVDARSDIFGLGCTMYRLLTDAYPYPGPVKEERLRQRTRAPHVPVRQARPDLPSDLAEVVDRMLSRRPEGRFAGAAEAAEALESLTCYRRPNATGPRRGPKGWEREALATTAGPPAEPDLPLLDASVLEAALAPGGAAAPAPARPRAPARAAARAPEARELEGHRRALESDGESSGRDVHRLYHGELTQLRRAEIDALEKGDEARAPSCDVTWFERLGERLGDLLAEPTAPKVVVLVLIIVVALLAALGMALS